MQAEWELCKENFQPLKRGRKEVCKQESKVCQKGDVEGQRRCGRLCRVSSYGSVQTFQVAGLSGRSLRHTVAKIPWTSGSGPTLCLYRPMLFSSDHIPHTSCAGSSSGRRIPSEAVGIKLSCCRFWSAAHASCNTYTNTSQTLDICASGFNTYVVQLRYSNLPCSSATYCSLCVQADCLPEPRDVFNFLKV